MFSRNSKHQTTSWGLLVTKEAMELDDELIFLFSEISPLEVRPEVVDPPEAAALAAAEESGGLWQRSPAPLPVGPYIRYQPIIFLLCPCPFVRVSFLTTW